MFRNNRAGHGGSIVNYGTMVISNSTFTENYASERGGAIANTGNLAVSNSAFTRNNSPNGGAMSTNANPDVRSSTFSRNSATNGGAIFVAGNNFTLTNSTLWSNTAGQIGGAIMRCGRGGAITRHPKCFLLDGATAPFQKNLARGVLLPPWTYRTRCVLLAIQSHITLTKP